VIDFPAGAGFALNLIQGLKPAPAFGFDQEDSGSCGETDFEKALELMDRIK